VADDEVINPKTPKGMVNFRAEMAAYKYIDATPTLTRGMPKVVPYDFFNHLMDAQRGVAVRWFARAAPLAQRERIERQLNEWLRLDVIETDVAEGRRNLQGAWMARVAQLAKVEAQDKHAQYVHPLVEIE